MKPMRERIFYRPMTKNGEDILFAGKLWADGFTSDSKTEPEAQHLGCFAGGMVAVGAKVFDIADDMKVARKLVNGCLWGYETGALGIMPEIIHTVPCLDPSHCPWSQEEWHNAVKKAFINSKKLPEEIIKDHHLPPGVTKINDARYILR
jgi:mannosyl-oligosaccharide alpha-1,2-mannosidase